MFRNHAEIVLERLRIGIHVEPDEAAPGRAREPPDRQLFARRALRKRFRIGNGDQLAFQVVFPQVVRAAERLRVAARAISNLVTAVRTDVVERVDAAVFVARQHDALALEVGYDVVAGILQVAFPAAHQPGFRPQPLPFALREFRRRVARRRNDVVAELRIGLFLHRRLARFADRRSVRSCGKRSSLESPHSNFSLRTVHRPSTTFATMFFCTSRAPPKIDAARPFRYRAVIVSA